MTTRTTSPAYVPTTRRVSSRRTILERWAIVVLFAIPGCASSSRSIAPSDAAPSASVRPGINDNYRDANLEEWLSRFEVESREVFHERERIVERMRLRRGEVVADVGSGTGAFVEPISRRVGPTGQVLAVDIVPTFIEHIRERSVEHHLANVTAVLAVDRSATLPPASVDAVFICDTYHHFEYPGDMLASIHRGLGPRGRLYIVDFERIPGVSREWIMNHVRLSREQVIEEVEHAGFKLVRHHDTPFLAENYLIEFRRR